MGKLKIFLSYHKNTPLYKSDVFEPIQVGAAINDIRLGMITDNTGDNISHLNNYYCELTAYYYILKNYIDTCEEDYIGFAHYRRLIDLTQISEKDTPSIYGVNYSNAFKLFKSFKNYDLAEKCKPYDIILPCSAYMYKETVNPEIRKNEPPIDMYNQFKIEHKNNLIDILKEVITEKYPSYIDAMNDCFSSTSAHFYNIYVMKKDILKEFLIWEFDILNEISETIRGWENSNFYRMAGFIGERLINIWLKANKDKNYKIGYTPVYMIDFESEYIQNANHFHFIKRYDLELEELKHLLEISSDRFSVYLAILKAYFNLNDDKILKKQISEILNYTKTYEELLSVISICEKYNFHNITVECYEQVLAQFPNNIDIARKFLNFAKKTHNIEITMQAWKHLINLNITPQERSDYENFMKIYSLL